jgi:ribosomal protein L30/L7E
VALALRWAFADLDELSVSADKDTLTPEDLAKVVDLLRLRHIQFCLFLEALVGTGEMLRMMVEAIKVAKNQG